MSQKTGGGDNMFQTTREKRLALVLCGTFVPLFLWNVAGGLLMQPITATQQELRGLEARHAQLAKQMSIVDRATTDIAAFYCGSLPPNPANASVTYQHWLLDQLKAAGIEVAVVTPGPPTPVKDVGHRIPVSISASAATTCIGEFLDRLDASDILHRVTHLNVTSSGNASSEVRNMTLGLVAISLDVAEPIDELPKPSMKHGRESLVSIFSEQDIFQRKLPRRIPPAAERQAFTKAIPPPRPPEAIRFIGSVMNGQSRQAWFVNSESL